ncbi:MAG: hypothetical protein WC846_01720 [Candidatus Gracilibacteria bacterium]|jgi:hypothetical protein
MKKKFLFAILLLPLLALFSCSTQQEPSTTDQTNGEANFTLKVGDEAELMNFLIAPDTLYTLSNGTADISSGNDASLNLSFFTDPVTDIRIYLKMGLPAVEKLSALPLPFTLTEADLATLNIEYADHFNGVTDFNFTDSEMTFTSFKIDAQNRLTAEATFVGKMDESSLSKTFVIYSVDGELSMENVAISAGL